MKWGSMKPSTIRRSASTYARFMKTERPSAVVPASASPDGSWAAWLTMR